MSQSEYRWTPEQLKVSIMSRSSVVILADTSPVLEQIDRVVFITPQNGRITVDAGVNDEVPSVLYEYEYDVRRLAWPVPNEFLATLFDMAKAELLRLDALVMLDKAISGRSL